MILGIGRDRNIINKYIYYLVLWLFYYVMCICLRELQKYV